MLVFKTWRRVIKQFFEINYWYCSRRLLDLSFDEEKNKYVRTKDRAFHISKCTWEGTYDILNMMQLKIEHIFYNLKRYGVEANWYIFGSHLENCSKKDQKIFLQALIDSAVNYVENPKKCYKYLEKDTKLRTISIPFWIASGHINEDTQAKLKGFIVNYYDKKWKNIIDTKLSFYFEIHGNINKEVKTTEYDFSERTLTQLEDILRDLDKKIKEKVDYSFGFKDEDIILKNLVAAHSADSVYLTPAIYCQLSAKTKAKCMGNRVKLRKLLELRRLIRKVANISSFDDKYFDLWRNAPEDKKSSECDKGFELYRKDVKSIYDKINNFFIENHEMLWD